MGALKIGLNRIKTWLKAKTRKKKSVRAKAGERRNSSFHFNPWARQSNLIFSVISAAPNASWELCRLCSVLVSMPREINHRPEAAGVTHISLLLPLAWHQAAGAPPQSREQRSSHAYCKILAGTHLMRCTVIFIFLQCFMPLDTAQGGFGVVFFFFFAHLAKNLQLIISPMDGAVAQSIFRFCYLWQSTSHMKIYCQTLHRV